MKRKLLIFLLTVISAVCLAFGLAACDGNTGILSSNSGTTASSNEDSSTTTEMEDSTDSWYSGVYTISTAYAAAQNLGYSGTLEEFIASITGSDGKDGTNGTDGIGIADISINDDGELVITLSSGTDINLGKINGLDGVGVSSVVINSDGQLVITLTDTTEINCGTVVGSNGTDGVGVSSVTINDSGELVITFTNNISYNLGNVMGTDGKDGEDGADGKGISSIYFNSSNELIITYTDDTYTNLGTVPACNHIYGEWITGKEATCTSIGYNYRICTICGNVEYEFIEATGHTVEEYSYDESFHYYICNECDLYLTQAHSLDDDGVCTVCEYKADYSVGLAYSLNSDKKSYTLTGIGTCTDTDIVIPSIYKGLPVTVIGNSAFINNISLTSVVVGDNVTSINDYAIAGCISLTSITIGSEVTSIGWGAFSSCGSVTDIYFNATDCGDFDSWSYHPFQGCGRDGVGFTLHIGSNVKSIQAYFMAWEQSSSPYEAKIIAIIFEDNSVCESIGQCAFEGCVSLTNITIPQRVTSIGEYAFAGCYKLVEVYNLSSLTITAGSSGINYVSYYAKNVYTATNGESNLIYSDDYMFYNDDGTYYLVSYVGKETDIALPDEINGNNYSIYQYAFYNYYYDYGYLSPSYITSVTIPDGVKTIGNCAFYGCGSLESVTIPDSVTSIGGSAFYYTAYYNDIDNWVDDVLYIGNYLIKADASVSSSYTIKDGTTLISDNAFAYCTSLTSVIIPNSVKTIGNNAFYVCSSLESVTV